MKAWSLISAFALFATSAQAFSGASGSYSGLSGPHPGFSGSHHGDGLHGPHPLGRFGGYALVPDEPAPVAPLPFAEAPAEEAPAFAPAQPLPYDIPNARPRHSGPKIIYIGKPPKGDGPRIIYGSD